MRCLLLFMICLAGCASSPKLSKASRQMAEQIALKERTDSRAVEEARMRTVTSEIGSQVDPTSKRGADIMMGNEHQAFNLNAMNRTPDTANWLGNRSSNVSKFGFSDRAYVKSFGTNDFNSKSAWMRDTKYATKAETVTASATKTSWFSRFTARTKAIDTRTAMEAPKAVAVRGALDGRPFLVQGRRQADFDRKGPGAQGGYTDGGGQGAGTGWSGQLSEVKTIDDVKALLNKN